eukprot:CAMPEP_0178705890 /NCGR_PEP_ID=MMETSP0699-20121125/15075_1 /TAXON_ID=265572 /ORGANISM="Extubocellulus spinifer, Strain CCMP396" /LENGTH=71 /DNA_ID=CAMNT_0020353575 /DNA_START=650 /DNA_END=865 /DNA_ORIENTATION=-
MNNDDNDLPGACLPSGGDGGCYYDRRHPGRHPQLRAKLKVKSGVWAEDRDMKEEKRTKDAVSAFQYACGCD